jgi:putative restriction endonuclease
VDEPTLPEGRDKESLVRVRVNQRFFRSAVLAAYDFRCCITGLSLTRLLTASHIVPWAVDPKNRTNPQNGLCLNAIHDLAFDCGLMTVVKGRVTISPAVLKRKDESGVKELLLRYDGREIRMPHRFAPDPSFLKYHFEHVFVQAS